MSSTDSQNMSKVRAGADPPPDENLRQLFRAMQSVQAGDFSVRVDGDWEGVHGKLADVFNDIIIANERMASELERIGYGVGKQGRTRQRFSLGRRGGA